VPRWKELIERADVIAPPMDPVSVELLRPQAAFNHALLDALSRWPQLGADRPRERARLEALLGAPRELRSHREGIAGRLVEGAKHVVVPIAERVLARWKAEQRALNEARLGAFTGGSGVGAVPEGPFERQAQFDALLNAELPELLAFDSNQAVYARWIAEREAKPLADRAVPDDWVLWKDDAVELAPGAAAAFLAECDGVDLLYADEDWKGRTRPFFKPGWSRELALERDLLGGAVFVRRAAMQGATPLDWALALPAQRIRRVARVLSHRSATSAWHEEAVRRLFPSVERHEHGLRVRRPPPKTLVSIIVPFRDKPELMAQLFRSVERHPPGVDVEWILVDNGSRETVPTFGATVVRDGGDFNFSRLNNRGAAKARGEYLLFLNNDIEVASDGWLASLLEYAGAGVVGANLWYPDGTLQHSGVVVGLRGLAGHVFARSRGEETAFGSPLNTREVSAVTGACMLMKREAFQRVGGFDESLPISGGDVELCLRIGHAINVAHLKLIHHESLSRGAHVPRENIERERELYRRALPQGDPFYNPNLTQRFTTAAPDLEPSRSAPDGRAVASPG
jgi:GT2 family glycosyltransferase